MKAADFAADALSNMSDRLIAGLDGLSVEQQCYRPDPDANTNAHEYPNPCAYSHVQPNTYSDAGARIHIAGEWVTGACGSNRRKGPWRERYPVPTRTE